MKKYVAFFLAIVVLLNLISVTSAMTVLSSQNLSIDGKTVDVEKYNIDGNNYFKLRDIAYLLNGTPAQFAVGWDSSTQTVSVLTKESYSKIGGELDLGSGDKSATAKPSKQTLQIDGKTITGLSVYNIGGNNYFKLRDLGNALGFGVGYDNATRTATIDSSVTKSTDAQKSTGYTPEEIFQQCSPAVFYIEVYDAYGIATASGSGFFIDSDGTAVTNFHVIDGAYSAKILRSDTGDVHNVVGVYDFNKTNDWAVIKIEGSGFPYLVKGNPSTVVGGASVYAIGSPKGLDNTISEGIISNPSRQLDGITYIQISAAISHGSSGGALINKYGEVIGITSAGIESGENIGFVLPISVIDGCKMSSITQFENATHPQTVDPLAYLQSFIKTNGKLSYIADSIYDYELQFSEAQGIEYSLVYAPDTGWTYIKQSYKTAFSEVQALLYFYGAGSDDAYANLTLWVSDYNYNRHLGYGSVNKANTLKNISSFELYQYSLIGKTYTTIPISVAQEIGRKAVTDLVYEADAIFSAYGLPISMYNFGYRY